MNSSRDAGDRTSNGTRVSSVVFDAPFDAVWDAHCEAVEDDREPARGIASRQYRAEAVTE